MTEPGKASYRPVRVIGLLLVLQVIGLAGIGVHEFASVDWDEVDFIVSIDWEEGARADLNLFDADQLPESQAEAVVSKATEAILFAVLFLPPMVLMLLAGLSFLLLKRRGWLLAAIAQGLSLGVCLFIYTNPELETGGYVYPIMIYCILMILYLNSQDVRVVFHSRRSLAKQEAEATYES